MGPYKKPFVASHIAKLRTYIVNVYFIQIPDQRAWVLVDAGTAFSASLIRRMAERLFGKHCRPKAIILTHGHFDHVGALADLLSDWDVPVYAHRFEMPYLTGKANYLPPDPTVGGGLIAWLSPLYPHEGINLGEKVKPLSEDGAIPFLPGWRAIHTPGHTRGHISLFREEDRVLLTGDAFITVKQESLWAVLLQQKGIHGPPMYFTPDWEQARQSVIQLYHLQPTIALPGHGMPMYGEQLQNSLEQLVKRFDELAIPDHGRYGS
ncbi:MBL fold metallo-hydrolase [Thermaerobacillus caldiproteolyticus]|uniref:Glyoxylase-like metal-dependent hydrolase (Beta-lactamase superfamily II) n=1 Tax=Thermaerobacillus caldiproteolyticus TaxID=247480 RepID=A0A7V9Z7J7_9BACL|nr:MBL fold metallo-hydrolase [Anoxybacillus caldiproteolyticus]MBA2875517.1 glyoxylase-like metal-dependent hydrolase (beta-lactamase superfamily II) [Anoxybacillus caldiproteolyticus]